jgi:hypothetical protein
MYQSSVAIAALLSLQLILPISAPAQTGSNTFDRIVPVLVEIGVAGAIG